MNKIYYKENHNRNIHKMPIKSKAKDDILQKQLCINGFSLIELNEEDIYADNVLNPLQYNYAEGYMIYDIWKKDNKSEFIPPSNIPMKKIQFFKKYNKILYKSLMVLVLIIDFFITALLKLFVRP